jgi:hypothetical protein
MSSPLTTHGGRCGSVVKLAISEEARAAPCVPLDRPEFVPHVGVEANGSSSCRLVAGSVGNT